MESVISLEAIVAAATVLLMGVLGYLGQGGPGCMSLGIYAVLASVLCIAGTWLGGQVEGSAGAWAGLATAILVIGRLAWSANKGLSLGRSGWFGASLWFGYCALCVYGYLAGDWVGLLTITLPSIVLFWLGLYLISAYILPIDGTARHRSLAFRSLMTFLLGTNYPYYFVRDGRTQKRVEGDSSLRIFAGPGIVYTACDHAAYLTDGTSAREAFLPPGLTFTESYQLPPLAIDLRPQFRTIKVEARTRDTIPIMVPVHLLFGIDPGGQEPRLGEPFPFLGRALFSAVAWQTRDGGRLRSWDELVPLRAAQMVQEMLSEFSFRDLYPVELGDRDIRTDLRNLLYHLLREPLLVNGIRLVGCGLGDIESLDKNVTKAAIQVWQARMRERALVERLAWRAEAQAELIEAALEACGQADTVDDMARRLMVFLDRKASEMELRSAGEGRISSIRAVQRLLEAGLMPE